MLMQRTQRKKTISTKPEPVPAVVERRITLKPLAHDFKQKENKFVMISKHLFADMTPL